jgi:RNA recognition motif-containing protein
MKKTSSPPSQPKLNNFFMSHETLRQSNQPNQLPSNQTSSNYNQSISNPNNDTFSLFISNLSEKTTKFQILSIFKKRVKVVKCEISKMKEKRCKGFAVILVKNKRKQRPFSTIESLINFLDSQNLVLNGRRVKIEEFITSPSDRKRKELEESYFKVCVQRIPKQMKEARLKMIFERFGTVDHFYMRKRKNKDFCFGFVTFTHVESATRAIEQEVVWSDEFRVFLDIKPVLIKDLHLIETRQDMPPLVGTFSQRLHQPNLPPSERKRCPQPSLPHSQFQNRAVGSWEKIHSAGTFQIAERAQSGFFQGQGQRSLIHFASRGYGYEHENAERRRRGNQFQQETWKKVVPSKDFYRNFNLRGNKFFSIPQKAMEGILLNTRMVTLNHFEQNLVWRFGYSKNSLGHKIAF